MSDDDPRQNDSFDSRLRDLRERTGLTGNGDDSRGTQSGSSGIGAAGRIATDLVAGVLGGAGIGYLLDWLLGTSPWLLVAVMLLGFAGGLLNAYRTARRLSEQRDE